MHLKKITIFPWLSFAFLLLFEYLLGAKFHRKLRWPMSTERGTPSRKWDPRAWWWRGNWRGRSRIKSSTASSFRDFEQAGFFSRIVSPAIIFFIRFIKVWKITRHSVKSDKRTFSVPVLQRIFSSVLSIAMSPKLRPEKRAEKHRQVKIIKIVSQSGSIFSYVRICNNATLSINYFSG